MYQRLGFLAILHKYSKSQRADQSASLSVSFSLSLRALSVISLHAMSSAEREMEQLTSGASTRIIPILRTLRASLVFVYTFIFFLLFILPRRRRLSSPVLGSARPSSPGKRLKWRSRWLIREEEDTMRRRALAENVDMGLHDGWSRCSTTIFYGVRRNALFCRSWFPLSGYPKYALLIFPLIINLFVWFKI